MRSYLLTAVAAIVLAALTTTAAPAPAPAAAQDARTLIWQHVDVCTRDHGYDPREPGNVGETDVTDSELAWRRCMYERVEKAVIPGSPTADAWQALIDADRSMTAQIRAATMTRSQRAAQLQALIAQIHLAEIVAVTHRLRRTEDSPQGATERQRIYDELDRIRSTAPAVRFF